MHPELAELDSYPFLEKSITLAHQGGGEWGRGTVFNQTCPPGHVVVGVSGSYYDYYNPQKWTGQFVRRVDLICQPLLTLDEDEYLTEEQREPRSNTDMRMKGLNFHEGAHPLGGILGTTSNDTVLVSNNHSLSIYSRTLTRYSIRQEYLSPEQLDLDCVTPGGKGHLDECRLLHGVWSPQQTIYTEDDESYGFSCGPNEIFVGQTVDLIQLELTCEDDGFGCVPTFRMCNYTFNVTNGADIDVSETIVVPCHGALPPPLRLRLAGVLIPSHSPWTRHAILKTGGFCG
jgi:hypothetical protein